MDIKTKIFSKKINAKRRARILAVEALYTHDIRDDLSWEQLLLNTIDINNTLIQDIKDVNTKYLTNLLKGTITNVDNIDAQIEKHISKEWKFDRLPKVVKSILRVGIFEISYDENLSKQILINEYLEIAKLLMHDGEVGFINSILDRVYAQKNI